MRTVGVEEELLLVDPHTGRPVNLASRVLLATTEVTEAQAPDARGQVESELHRTMVETQSAVATDLATVREDLIGWRRRTSAAARRQGATLAALATSPVAYDGVITANERYEWMAERYGVTATQVLSCGCHVHVGIESEEEGIGVIDRIRRWLPVLLAISANSPFTGGQDTSYASYRSQMWARWPSAGPTDAFGTPEAYHALVADMVSSGVVLDEGMVYFDARLSRRYPTVEVRVADVCMDVEDALLVAALTRGLVETSAAAWARGEPAPDVPTALIRLAMWQAGREGVDGMLLDPQVFTPGPASRSSGSSSTTCGSRSTPTATSIWSRPGSSGWPRWATARRASGGRSSGRGGWSTWSPRRPGSPWPRRTASRRRRAPDRGRRRGSGADPALYGPWNRAPGRAHPRASPRAARAAR